jgi:hypothetical protein
MFGTASTKARMRPAVISYLSSVRVVVFGNVSEVQQSSVAFSPAPHVSMPGPLPFVALHDGGRFAVGSGPASPASPASALPSGWVPASSPPEEEDDEEDDEEEDDDDEELLPEEDDDDALPSGVGGATSPLSSPPQAAKQRMQDAIDSEARAAKRMSI